MKRITFLLLFLLSWIALPVSAQTYSIYNTSRVSLSNLKVGKSYLIFSTAIAGTNTSGLAYTGFLYDGGNSTYINVNRDSKLPKNHTANENEVWTLMAKDGATVTFKNLSTGNYITSDTSNPLSESEGSVMLYNYSSLPSGVGKMSASESSVSDDGTSCINCNTGDFSKADVYGIVATDKAHAFAVRNNAPIRANYDTWGYPFTFYEVGNAQITFNYVEEGVTYYTTTENVVIGETFDYIVPNAYKGYAISSATDGTNTVSAGGELTFEVTGDATITITLGTQNDIRDFKQLTTNFTLEELNSLDDVEAGQRIVMQVQRPDDDGNGVWSYMFWDDEQKVGKSRYMHGYMGYVFTIDKAEANVEDGETVSKTVQIADLYGHYFPALSGNGKITLGEAADYTLYKNETTEHFQLKNGTKGIDNDAGLGNQKIAAWDYTAGSNNQQIRIWKLTSSEPVLSVADIPLDVLGNPVTDGGTYAIRMPARSFDGASPNRYLTGEAGNNHIVHADVPFNNTMQWTLNYAPEGLTLKSNNNGNYASYEVFYNNGYADGKDKNFLTASDIDAAEIWFPTAQSLSNNGTTYNGYALETTSGNMLKNYLSNFGGYYYATWMGYYNSATDRGSVFQFVPTYTLTFVDESGNPVSATFNGVASTSGEFVVPHSGYYTFSTVTFPDLSLSTLEELYFDINGTEWDFQGLCAALAKITENTTVTVKSTGIDYTTSGGLTRINDKNDNKVVTGSRYFLKMRQNASGTTDAEIDANVAYQTKDASGQISPLAWNGNAAQVWKPYGTLKTIVLQNSDDTYLKVTNYPESGIGYGTSFGFDSSLANATPFSAWPCDATLLRYYLTTSKADGSKYQYTSDVVNSTNTAGLNTEIVTSDVGEKIQFVPAIKLSFVINDEEGNVISDATITYDGITFDNTTMGDIYVEKGKAFSSLTITEVSGDNAGTHEINSGLYTFQVGTSNIRYQNLASTLASLTGDATITIKKKTVSANAIDGLFDVNGDLVESDKPYRLQFKIRGDYYLTQSYGTYDLVPSSVIMGDGKQHWYVQPTSGGKVKLAAANGKGYVSCYSNATGSNHSEAALGGTNSATKYTAVQTATLSHLKDGNSFLLRWNSNSYYFDGGNNASATFDDNKWFTLVTASDTTFYLMRTATSGDENPTYIKKVTSTRNEDITETTDLSEAAPFMIVQRHDSIFTLKTWTDPADNTTFTYIDNKATAGAIPLTWNIENQNSAVKFLEKANVESALEFAYSRDESTYSADEYVYTLQTTVNEIETYLGNPWGVSHGAGFYTNPTEWHDCDICFVPVVLATDIYGQEITNGTYRIELPKRAEARGQGPVTLTMNGGAGYNLSDRNMIYVNPQCLPEYRLYNWLSDIEDNVQYRYDDRQVFTLEFNGIAGVYIKNADGKYLKADSFTEGTQKVSAQVDSKEDATLWMLRPVTVSGMTNTFNIIAANDTITEPANWYLSNHGGGNGNIGFFNSATDNGCIFNFTPMKQISREEAYNQGIINGYGFICYGLGYKNNNYAEGDCRDSIQGYELPEQLWLPYNAMSNSYSYITFHQPDLIGYNYDNGVTEPNHSDHIIRYTGYELDAYPIISSKPPYMKDGEWTFDDDTHWYAITLRASDKKEDPLVMRHDFVCGDNDKLSKVTSSPFCDRYLWCFVGDSINGYLVYNKGVGAGKYMGSNKADYIATSAPNNITWLPNDNSDEVKLYSKHLFQKTQHTYSDYYMLMDRYTGFSFERYGGKNCYWHARYQLNGSYLKNVLGTTNWTGKRVEHQAASYEKSIYHNGGSYVARTMTFPNLDDVYKKAINASYFQGFVGFVGMHENADSVVLNMRRLNANLEAIGTVNPDDYATNAAFKAALLRAQQDSLAAYDLFLANLYEYGVKYDEKKAYRLINEKTGKWLSVAGDNNDGDITLIDTANYKELVDPGTLWKFIDLGSKDHLDNSSLNNKKYKLHNIYRSANLKINGDGTVSLEREAYGERSSKTKNSGKGTDLDLVNDMTAMQSWGEFVVKPVDATITGTGTGQLLSSTKAGTFSTGYDLGDDNTAARWFLKGFDLDSVSLSLPETADQSASQVYSSYIDPDNDFTWPYEHGLSAWRMTWRHDAVIRGQKIVPDASSNDRPFIPAGTGILFRGPKGVKFPLLPCSTTATINSLLVSPAAEDYEEVTVNEVLGYVLPKESGYVIDYVNGENIVRCCLIGSDDYTTSNYTEQDGGIFLPKNKPYIPNDDAHKGSQDYTLLLELEDEFGNVTRIGTIDANGNVNLNDENAFYDMQGRRVNQPVKGQIYIHNGQKVYFK